MSDFPGRENPGAASSVEPRAPLTFHAPDDANVTLHCQSLIIEAAADQAHAVTCRLVTQATLDAYARIEAGEYFYLSPQVRTPATALDFVDDSIEIELRLHPDIFSTLLDEILLDEARAQDALDAAALWRYLAEQNRAQPEDSIFSTDSWLALGVAQSQNGESVGYRTLWNDLTPSASDPGSIFSPETLQTVLGFLAQREDWSEDEAPARGAGREQEHEPDSQFGSADADPESALAELGARLAELDRQLADLAESGLTAQTGPDDSRDDAPVAELFARYFQESGWGYDISDDGSTFRLRFQGDTAAWQCFALAREAQAQAVFYSIAPEPTPDARRAAMAELLTRANYALVTGNFEMDWEDGEVRFKTGLDATGETLNTGWLHNLVVANLQTMNYYLPAIQAVVRGEAAPQAALAALES